MYNFMVKYKLIIRIIFYFILYSCTQIFFDLPAFPSFEKLFGFLSDTESIERLGKALFTSLYIWVKIFIPTLIGSLGVAFWLGYNAKLSAYVASDFDFWRSIPATTLHVFAFALLDDGIIARTLPCIYVTFFSIVYYVIKSSKSINNRVIEHLRELNASRAFVFLHGYIPEIFEATIIAVRQALSLSWLILISTELIIGAGGSGGIGTFLIDEGNALRYPSMLFCLLIIGITGYLINHIGFLLHKKTLYWKEVKD